MFWFRFYVNLFICFSCFLFFFCLKHTENTDGSLLYLFVCLLSNIILDHNIICGDVSTSISRRKLQVIRGSYIGLTLFTRHFIKILSFYQDLFYYYYYFIIFYFLIKCPSFKKVGLKLVKIPMKSQ